MKFPYAMLLDFVETKLTPEEIGDLLTMAGFELEGIEEVDGDSVLDIKVVSNRGDGLSVFGLSREVLAKDPQAQPTGLYRSAAARFVDSSLEESIQVNPDTIAIQAEACHRFSCRVFQHDLGSCQAPGWMQKRLHQAGMRSISLLVDLTNYVMLELGQPLHAFDRDKLVGGRIIVRHAQEGEQLVTLNGQEHTLAGQMMICDGARPVGVPGVMGGLATEVTDTTTHVLLESAHFFNGAVRKTRKQLGLNTEASYRFERSVDPDGVVAAIRRFSQLLREAVPEVQISNILDLYPRPPVRTPVRLRTERASRLLGMEISREQAADYLSRLGMHVVSEEAALIVTPPTWRPDIVREEDLVEELGRVHGYERIPEEPPFGTTTQGGLKGDYLRADHLRTAALRAGFVEILSHSLRDEHPLQASTEGRIGPRVPASPEHAVLRDSLLPSLADAAARNGGRDLHLVEVGKIFGKVGHPALAPTDGSPYHETRSLGLLSAGRQITVDRKGRESLAVDFFSLKGALNSVLEAAGVVVEYVGDSSDSRLHPTRQARLAVGGETIGLIGQLHPEVATSLRLPEETFVAEIDVDRALQFGKSELTLRAFSRNPAVRRDVTVDVPIGIPYEQYARAVRAAVGEVLERLWLVDDYSGTGVEAGRHALTLGMQFRKVGENFTDEEANQVRDRAVAALTSMGATMR